MTEIVGSTDPYKKQYNEQMTLDHLKYRPDIDGLRAIAVLSVVFYHAFPDVLTGGFVGVDIFFVISGYLITFIISENIKNNKFSFLEFYERRIRRIFPALVVVLLFNIWLGWHTQLTEEYMQLGKHLAGASLFLSNFILFGESGYFDNAAETKPLLHLWSLSIEEQFYLLFPIFLLWIGNKAKVQYRAVLIVFFVSFLVNLFLTFNYPVAAFYWPIGRFWELMAGSLLALSFVERKPKFDSQFGSIFSVLGLLILICSVLFVSKDMNFPGWIALFPVAGAYLIIWSGPNAFANKYILSARPFVLIGLVSYPIYLWHWSLLVLPRIFEGQLTLRSKIIGLVCTLIFSILTYKFVERPFRYGSRGLLKSIVLVTALFLVGFFGLNTYDRDGLPNRTFVKINSVPVGFDGGSGGFLKDECGLVDPAKSYKFRHCISDTRNEPIYALYGDSKAGSLYTGLIRTSSPEGRWLVIGGNGPNGSPGSTLTEQELTNPSDGHSSLGIEAIARNPKIKAVVVATATRGLFPREGYGFKTSSETYNASLAGMTNLVKKLVLSGKHVVLLVDNPTFPDPKSCLIRTSSLDSLNKIYPERYEGVAECDLKYTEHVQTTKDYRRLLSEIKLKYPNSVYIFDTATYLCDSEKDKCYLDIEGRSLYDDGDHISDFASGLIGKPLNDFVNNLK